MCTWARERKETKLWLEPIVELAQNWDFAPHELTRIIQLTEQNREMLLEKWHEYFGEA